MFKNDEEYFADKEYISNSMIGDYLKSPAYYEAKHVSKIIPKQSSPAMVLGLALDCMLTEGLNVFGMTYSKQCLKRDNPELFEQNKTGAFEVLTEAAWNQIHTMAGLIEELPLYKEIKDKADKQVILTGQFGTGYKVKGKLDFLVVENDTAYIYDLKTSSVIKPIQYHYHCLDYGYYRQMAMYKNLVIQNYKVKKVVCKHIVINKDPWWNKCSVFTLNEDRIDKEMNTITDTIRNINAKAFDEVFEEHEIGEEKEASTFGLKEIDLL